MPSIVFVGSRIGPQKSTEVEGGDLLDICDQILAPVPFSCRSATCGTCHIEVLEGAELLEPADEFERDLLELMGNLPNHRLACQAKVKKGQGKLVIRPVLACL